MPLLYYFFLCSEHQFFCQQTPFTHTTGSLAESSVFFPVRCSQILLSVHPFTQTGPLAERRHTSFEFGEDEWCSLCGTPKTRASDYACRMQHRHTPSPKRHACKSIHFLSILLILFPVLLQCIHTMYTHTLVPVLTR